jgi:hypothetical protein
VDLKVSQLPSPLIQLSQVRKMRQGSCTGWQTIISLSNLTVTDCLHCQISVIHLADIQGGNAREAGNLSFANLPLEDRLQLCLRFPIWAGVKISISVCNIKTVAAKSALVLRVYNSALDGYINIYF